MSDDRRKTLDELSALTERLDLYNEPTRVGDEASVALSHALQELRWVEAERDELRAERDALATYALQIADAFNGAEEARPGIIEMTRELADLVSANLQNLATFGLGTEDDNE